MPSLIIPDAVTMNTGAGVGDNTSCLQGLILNNDTEDVTYEGETISRGEYIKRYLFSGKYNDIITFDKIYSSGYPQYFSSGMYIDGDNIDNRLSFFTSNRNYYSLAFDAYRDIKNSSVRSPGDPYNLDRDYQFLYAYSAVPTGDMSVRAFDTFMILSWNRGVNAYWSVGGTSVTLYMLYDIANHELVIYNPTLAEINLITPDGLDYAKPLTKDGNTADMKAPVFRKSSFEEVSYAPITRIDGIEATRIYMLTMFPENSIWNTIRVGDKYFLILPYDTSTDSTAYFGAGGHERYCGLAIDVTEDIENQ